MYLSRRRRLDNNVKTKYGAEIADRCKAEIEKLFPISKLDLVDKEHYRFVMKILNELLQNEY